MMLVKSLQIRERNLLFISDDGLDSLGEGLDVNSDNIFAAFFPRSLATGQKTCRPKSEATAH